MLHRFERHGDLQQLAQWAHVDVALLPAMLTDDSVARDRLHPVVRVSKSTGKREFVWMREGLIPSYACDDRGAEQRAEAHAEALTCDSCFRSAFLRRRCLIPASVLIERRHPAKDMEQACAFTLESGGLFAIAAVWDTWTNDQGRAVDSFAIVTALVTPTLRTLFDRMPVVLTDAAEQERWLQVATDHEHPPVELMRPLSVAQLREWRMMPGSVDLQMQPGPGLVTDTRGC